MLVAEKRHNSRKKKKSFHSLFVICVDVDNRWWHRPHSPLRNNTVQLFISARCMLCVCVCRAKGRPSFQWHRPMPVSIASRTASHIRSHYNFGFVGDKSWISTTKQTNNCVFGIAASSTFYTHIPHAHTWKHTRCEGGWQLPFLLYAAHLIWSLITSIIFFMFGFCSFRLWRLSLRFSILLFAIVNCDCVCVRVRVVILLCIKLNNTH